MDLEPLESVLHEVELPVGPGIIGIECDGTHLFDRENCFRRWVKGYAGRSGSVFELQDYLNYARVSHGAPRQR